MGEIRVLYISYDGLLDPLGRSQVFPYMKKLSLRGADIDLLTFEKHEKAGSDVFTQLKKEAESFGIRWKPLRYHKKPPLLSKLFDVFNGSLAAFSAARASNPGILHARSYVAGLMALIVKKLTGALFIFDIRGFWVDERLEAGMLKDRGVLYKAGKRLEKLLFCNADGIVTLTAAAAREIGAFGYLKCRSLPMATVPTCVDLEMFRRKDILCKQAQELKSRLAGRFVLAYSGSLSTWFMPEEMLGFFRELKGERQDAFFMVLTTEKDKAHDLMGGSGLPADSFCVVSADYGEVADYLSLAHCGIVFYRKGYSNKGRSPTKIGEYLACGLPVAINKGIGDTESVLSAGAAGVIAGDFNKEEYRKAALRLLGLCRQEEELRLRCRRAAEEHFSLERGADAYFEFYRSMLKGRRRK